MLDPDPQLCFQQIFDMSFLTLGGPVFVYDWPAASKPFYMARSLEVRTFHFFSLVPVPMFCLSDTCPALVEEIHKTYLDVVYRYLASSLKKAPHIFSIFKK
jgi:hypothetical protein